MLYANLLLNVLYHIEIEMKIRESCLQTGNFIYKPGISLTKQDFHLQRGILGLQRGFSGYYLPTEIVDVFLKCSIKNYECAEQYFEELIKILQNDNDNFSFEKYDIFGEYDIIIIIKDIQIREILPLYSMGEILTHSNEEYNKAFYNIETSFICRK